MVGLRERERELYQEFLQEEDPVYRSIEAVRFVSRSKGWRTSKARGRYRRMRRGLKEVYLVKYNSGSQSHFHLWHNFPFDEYAPEILKGQGGEYPEHTLIERIRDIFGT
jgi:hypothetical protein